MYVQTKSALRKLQFLLPQLLSLLVAAYCMWQIGFLLHSITKQSAFENINFTRLRNVGWAIIFCQLGLLATQSQTKAFNLFIVKSGYYYPDLHFITWSAPPFSLTWLLIGAITLIFTLAFRRGAHLQEEQALTV